MALLRPSLLNLVLLLALPGWMVYARTVRGLVLGLKRREFVVAAVALGAPSHRIIARHLLPNVVAPVIVISSAQLAGVIFGEASLSSLGVGVQPPTPSCAAMLSQGREYLSPAWWLSVFPGLAIALAVLGMNWVQVEPWGFLVRPSATDVSVIRSQSVGEVSCVKGSVARSGRHNRRIAHR